MGSAGPLGLPQTAVFVDERAPLTQPLGQGQWGMKNIDQELLRMGAPHRSYYVDDLPAVDKASIRLAIFPNLLTPSKAVKAALAAWQQAQKSSLHTVQWNRNPTSVLRPSLGAPGYSVIPATSRRLETSSPP